ncbi:hypothetical protein SLT36_30270 (plasmid) [Aminobacter sp. BA135]|uniref:endonuclease toxin domain-containing protein n=1 Tax=Aminobacter sp. BA135 TaxID=537596 RepID=UPI003D7A6590
MPESTATKAVSYTTPRDTIYQNASTLNRTLTSYVDKVAGFQGQTWAGVSIRSQDITARSLDLAIPHGGSAAQQRIIDQSVKYGASRGVTVNVITP